MSITFSSLPLGALTLQNSTVSGNSASFNGGGIVNRSSTLTLTSVTITNNRAESDTEDIGTDGGIYNSGLTLLRNTIVADNYRGAGAAVEDDIQGVALDSASSFNLIGTGGSGGLTGGANNNRVGAANLGLEPLANNGGPTLTHALLARSPAIDKGKASG